VPAGEPFSTGQRLDLRHAVTSATKRSGLDFSLYVGPLEKGRDTALTMLEGLADKGARSVLVAVDPAGRALEIVTGPVAATWCDERACALAAVAMTSSIGAGDLLGGIKNGLSLLGEHAHQPDTLHTDTL
jgi:hypothetical protein